METINKPDKPVIKAPNNGNHNDEVEADVDQIKPAISAAATGLGSPVKSLDDELLTATLNLANLRAAHDAYKKTQDINFLISN